MATPQMSMVQETPVQMVWRSGQSLVCVQGYSQTCWPAIASLMQMVGQPHSELFWQGVSSLAASIGLQAPPLEPPDELLLPPELLLELLPPMQASAHVHEPFAQTGWQEQFDGQVQLGGEPEQPPLPLLPPLPPMQRPSWGSPVGETHVAPMGHVGPDPLGFGLQTCSQVPPAQKSPTMQSCERSWRVALRLQLDVAVPPW